MSTWSLLATTTLRVASYLLLLTTKALMRRRTLSFTKSSSLEGNKLFFLVTRKILSWPMLHFSLSFCFSLYLSFPLSEKFRKSRTDRNGISAWYTFQIQVLPLFLFFCLLCKVGGWLDTWLVRKRRVRLVRDRRQEPSECSRGKKRKKKPSFLREYEHRHWYIYT